MYVCISNTMFVKILPSRLTYDDGLLTRAALDSAHHRPVASPLLLVGQMRHRIQIGRNKLAS